MAPRRNNRNRSNDEPKRVRESRNGPGKRRRQRRSREAGKNRSANQPAPAGPPLSRRGLLKAAGTIGLTTTAIGAAAGRGGPPSWAGGDTNCECPDGTWLVAKFEYDEQTGNWEFEGSDIPVIDPSSSFSFSVTETNDDGEPMAVRFDSSPYAVTHAEVKAGRDCAIQSFEDTLPGYEEFKTGTDEGVVLAPDKYAISNIRFCAPPYWQIDIANTASPYEIGNPSAFVEGGAGSGHGCVAWMVGPYNLGSAGLSNYSGLDAAADCDTASVSFTLDSVPSNDAGSISVISAIAPALLVLGAPNAQAVVDYQEIYDEDAAVYTSDHVGSHFSHEVSIPGI